MSWREKALLKAESVFSAKAPSDVKGPCPLTQSAVLVQVLRGDKDEPVEGVQIKLTTGKTAGTQPTDGNGWTVFVPVVPDTYGIEYQLAGSSANGFTVSTEPGTQSASAGKTSVFLIVVNPVGQLKVEVAEEGRDGAKGSPVQGAQVTVKPAADNTTGATKSGPAPYGPETLASGKYNVEVSVPQDRFRQPASKPVVVPENNTESVVVLVKRIHWVKFKIVDEGDTVINGVQVQVKCSDSKIQTGTTGGGREADFPDVPPDTCDIVKMTHEKDVYEFVSIA